MRNIFKLASLFAIMFVLIISSCKKDEVLIEGCTDSAAMNFQSTATSNDGSCIYTIEGCTDSTALNYDSLANTNDSSCVYAIEGCNDSTAMNFQPLANVNDGSCIYAYDLAIGIWNIDPDCEEYTIPVVGTTIALNDQMPETIDVQGNDDNSLFIDMNGTQVSGDIDNNGNITVPKQTVSIDMGLGPMDIDVEGDGKIESESSGYMDLTYEFEIPIIGGTEALDCQLTLTK